MSIITAALCSIADILWLFCLTSGWTSVATHAHEASNVRRTLFGPSSSSRTQTPPMQSWLARLRYWTENSAWFQAGRPPLPSATLDRPSRSVASSVCEAKGAHSGATACVAANCSAVVATQSELEPCVHPDSEPMRKPAGLP